MRSLCFEHGLFLILNIQIMKAAGITAEYNPLHNGHVYHIDKTRQVTGCDAIVAAMSGDYVQRGEPAIMDKWTRTELALRSGADLVIEIPALYCLGNAGQYAGASVRLLESLGCVESISFGSECGDIELLRSVADFLDQYRIELDQAVRLLLKNGYNYPVARARAYTALRQNPDIMSSDSYKPASGRDWPQIYSAAREEQITRELHILESSNDILAMEYMRAMKKAEPVAVKREGAGYSDPYDIKFDYQSASALRTQFFDGRNISKYVPECTARALCLTEKNDRTDIRTHLTGPGQHEWFDMLRYAVLTTPAEVIEDCPSGGEGLANLMKTEIMKADSWGHFVLRVKSKRYTFTRISRLCMQVLLGITREKYSGIMPGYIRVLGFNSTGRELLSEIRKNEKAALPVITNINKEKEQLGEDAVRQLELDLHAADIYNLITGRDMSAYSDHRINPVIV